MNKGPEGRALLRCLWGTLEINIGTKEIIPRAEMPLQTIYSMLKELWMYSPDLIKFPFPMIAITDLQFEIGEGWTIPSVCTVNIARGRWREYYEDGYAGEWHYANDIDNYRNAFEETAVEWLEVEWPDITEAYIECGDDMGETVLGRILL